MGFKTSSTRFTQAKSAQSSDTVAYNNATGGTSVAGSGVTASTVINTVVTIPGSPATSTTIASGPLVTSIQYLDANNAVISGDIAVSTSGGNILITGTGFVANSSVYLNNSLVSNTFISSTQIRAICPAASAGNVSLMIFTPTLVGTIRANGVRYSGSPTWTTAAVSFQNGSSANVALVASSDSTLTYTLQAGSTLPTGISLVSAGYLSGTATGYNTNTSSTAVIVATDLEGQATQQTLNITVTVNDPQFPYTTLLINGETSVTPFIADASTNNFGLTVTGDTRADKFSPYRGDGYYSNYFNGSTDSLTIASNSALALGAGDFTFECWVYFSGASIPTYTGIYDQRNGTNGVGVIAPVVELTSANGYSWYVAAANKISSGSSAVKTNQWQHIAVSRVSGSTRMYIDGVQVGSTYTDANNYPAGSITIGRENDGVNTRYLTGYISNLRTIAGTGLYSGTTLTVPTSPLTAVANTKLLTCQSNRFIDNSTNAVAFTAAGTVQVSPNMPFAASSGYATYGGAYFDGTGDYLTVPASSNLSLGAGDFTIEAWVYTTLANQTYGSGIVGTYDGGTNGGWDLIINRSSGGPYGIAFIHANAIQQSYATYLTVNTWYHIAVTRSGTTLRTYLNGTQVATGTYATTDAVSATCYIGSQGAGQYHAGYISDVRVIKGTAVYTSAFTPPATPLTAVTNTQLLALQYNGGANNYGIIDNGPFNNAITRAGNATQGTFSPYAQTGWSNYFNGTSAYLSAPTNTAYQFGSGDFTVEFWAYPTSMAGYAVFGGVWTGTNSTSSWLVSVGATDTTALRFGYSDGSTATFVESTTGAVKLNTWTHLAVVRTSGVLKMFSNGAQVYSSAVATTFASPASALVLGAAGAANYGQFYASNFRVVKGTAVYTGAFTPPTAPLTAISGTSALFCQSNRFVDTSSINATLTLTGGPSVQAVSPFSPGVPYTPSLHGGSCYFDGTGDYLTLPGSNATNLGSSTSTAFTVEAWVYPTVSKDTTVVGCKGSVWRLALTSANLVSWVFNTSSVQTSTDAIKLNQWNHIAFTYDGLNLGSSNKMFVNGVVQAAQGQLIPPSNTTDIIYVGRNADSAAWDFQGYIADVRIIRGFAAYTANFTLPAAPLTSPTATPASLLLNFNAGGMIDQSGKVILDQQTSTPPQLVTNIKKYGTASIDCTGGKYMYNSLASQAMSIGTGDFTFEAWIYVTNTNVNGGMINLGNAISNEQLDFHVYFNTLFPYFAGSARNAGAAPQGTWNHYAIVRQSGVSKFYLDGVYNSTIGAITDSTNYTTTVLALGVYQSTYTASCYIDDLRITKGFARYTANFTPPTSGFLGQ